MDNILTFEEIKKLQSYTNKVKFDFSDIEIDDVLLKKINYANVEINAHLISDDEVYMDFNVEYNIDYLDAFDLSFLNLTFSFEDNAIFTTNFSKAKEFELEYIKEESIDVRELILDLIYVDIPLNYHESEPKINTDYDSTYNNTQTPFKNIFNKEN